MSSDRSQRPINRSIDESMCGRETIPHCNKLQGAYKYLHLYLIGTAGGVPFKHVLFESMPADYRGGALLITTDPWSIAGQSAVPHRRSSHYPQSQWLVTSFPFIATTSRLLEQTTGAINSNAYNKHLKSAGN